MVKNTVAPACSGRLWRDMTAALLCWVNQSLTLRPFSPRGRFHGLTKAAVFLLVRGEYAVFADRHALAGVLV